jgi:hypothetical protein
MMPQMATGAMPSPGSATMQGGAGMPQPTKMVGPMSPMTSAGNQQTQIQPTAYKSIPHLSGLQAWLDKA